MIPLTKLYKSHGGETKRPGGGYITARKKVKGTLWREERVWGIESLKSRKSVAKKMWGGKFEQRVRH